MRIKNSLTSLQQLNHSSTELICGAPKLHIRHSGKPQISFEECSGGNTDKTIEIIPKHVFQNYQTRIIHNFPTAKVTQVICVCYFKLKKH